MQKLAHRNRVPDDFEQSSLREVADPDHPARPQKRADRPQALVADLAERGAILRPQPLRRQVDPRLPEKTERRVVPDEKAREKLLGSAALARPAPKATPAPLAPMAVEAEHRN